MSNQYYCSYCECTKKCIICKKYGYYFCKDCGSDTICNYYSFPLEYDEHEFDIYGINIKNNSRDKSIDKYGIHFMNKRTSKEDRFLRRN